MWRPCCFRLIGPLADSFSHKLGLALLSLNALQPTYALALSMPLGPWLEFHNTVVAGSLAMGFYIAYPVYWFSSVLCMWLRPFASHGSSGTTLGLMDSTRTCFEGCRMSRTLRWQIVVPRLLLVVVLLLAAQYTLGRIVRRMAPGWLERPLTSESTLAHARVSLLRRELALNDLRIRSAANRHDPLLEIDRCELKFAVGPLLYKKGHV